MSYAGPGGKSGCSAHGGAPRRITSEDASGVRPSWSHDGTWIYFGSNQGGGWEIWRTRPEGGVPMQVTRHGGREAFEAPNGEFLFYTKAPPAAGIWWISCRNGGCDGGDETKISGAGKQGKWAVGGRGIYYLNGPDELVFQEFAGKRQTPISMPGLGFVAGVAAAPDDSSVLLTALVRYEVHLMLVRGFR